MGSNARAGRPEYPFGKFAVCWSAVVSGISILLSLLLLRDPAHLTLYFVSTFVLTGAICKLKIHVFLREDSSARPSPGKSRGIQKWKIVLLALSLLAVFMMSVGLLAILDPASWFVGLNSLACGLSLSEVGLFYYCRR